MGRGEWGNSIIGIESSGNINFLKNYFLRRVLSFSVPHVLHFMGALDRLPTRALFVGKVVLLIQRASDGPVPLDCESTTTNDGTERGKVIRWRNSLFELNFPTGEI